MTDHSTIRIFSADAIVPVQGRPFSNGSVATIDGIITKVGKRKEIINEYPDAEEKHWNGVLTPGLVNAHSHLQYTGFSDLGVVTHSGFEEWSVAFDKVYTDRHQSEDWLATALVGADMAIRSGTTAIADIVTDAQALSVLKDAGLSGYVFIEVMGGTWDQWQNGGRKEFLDIIKDAIASETDSIRIGISPHAPYSLDTRVLTDLGRIGIEKNYRLHTHLAESNHEDSYYRQGSGPLADFVAGIWPDFQILKEKGTGLSSTEFAFSTGIFCANCYIAHGIYIDKDDRAILRENNVPVALCPRSNLTIGLDPPPVAAYLDEGNPVCVGTDSLSSSPSLDLLEDVRLLQDLAIKQGYNNPDLPRRLIEAATINGAVTLGMDSVKGGLGSLAKGKRGDFAVFDIDPAINQIEERIVNNGAGQCIATIIGGKIVHET